MKQKVSLAVLLLAWLAVAGCAGGGGGQDAGQEGPPGQGEREEPDGVAVAGSCAAGGAPVDLVAEGTVEEVTVREGSSLAEFRVDRVLEGSAGDTVSVRTSSGSGAVAGYAPHFGEGDRYRLYLQGQGDVFTTNICLGTKPIK